MKKTNIATIISIIFLYQLAFSEQMDYFKSEMYEGEMPRGSEYYDELYKQKDITELTFQDWFNGPRATASWVGLRSTAEDNGITPVITYLGNFAGNPTGGNESGATNTSSVHLGLGLDLKKITGIDALEGWGIHNSWVWRFGDSLTKNYIGNTFNVQQNYGSQTMQMQSLFALFEKNIMGEELHLMLKFGRIVAGDNFMSKPIYWLYQNNAFDGNPVGVFYQTDWSAYPASTWGAMIQITHNSSGLYSKIGVYQISSDEQNNSQGLDLSFDGAKGVNLNYEFGWNINHDDSLQSPGNISAGIVSDWYNAVHNDDDSQYSTFNCSIYLQADYMIFNQGLPARDQAYYLQREKGDVYRDLRGLIAWFVLQVSPYENLALMPIFANGGLLYNAPFASRPDDVLCFGVAYGHFSDELTTYQNDSYEMALELNYKFQINRFMFIQPNIQYIINTDAGNYPNALVLGIQYGMAF